MNYAFRTGLRRRRTAATRSTSRTSSWPPLDEEHLDERAGIGGSGDFKTIWTNGKGVRAEGDANARLDWDGADSDGNGIANDDNGEDDKRRRRGSQRERPARQGRQPMHGPE